MTADHGKDFSAKVQEIQQLLADNAEAPHGRTDGEAASRQAQTPPVTPAPEPEMEKPSSNPSAGNKAVDLHSEIDPVTGDIRPLIIGCVQNNDLKGIEEYSQSKYPIDATDQHHWTALMYASQRGSTDAAKLLIENRAGVNVADELGWTPLMLAARKGHAQVVQLLVAAGARVNDRTKKGTTALMCAVGNGHKQVVQLLIAAGADARAKDNDDKSALDYAAERQHEEIASLLR
jgi:ankyrin repeat protein